ncbi:DoxX family protein [Bosea psychrotolerans]|uniref:Putative oxidoreductase n=1 Tax=Bosea psychrotolerans TaxID=1871628 RepID=A0A2S4M7Y6_9HYPH|nr:DoxX family protein [Bosea psychrotolerans]POR50850.1 putative oxidoreductase [Bosea psychrotolerans]
MTTSTVADVAALVGRLLLALLFLHEGWIKLNHAEISMAYMRSFGVPAWLFLPALGVEIGGGLLLVAGWGSRYAALVLAIFCISTAAIFHTVFTDGNQLLHFEKDLAIAGGLLVLFAAGPGRFSIGASESLRLSASPQI